MEDGTQSVENERTEFRIGYADSIPKTVVAFANGLGGSIFIGIDDDGNIVGVEDPDEVCRSAVNGISDNVRPDVMALISVSRQVLDGCDVVRIDVSEGTNKPYYVRSKGLKEGGVFIRRGSATIPASESLIRKMMRDWSDTPYESLISRNQDLTFETAAEIMEANGHELGPTQMISLGMREHDRYTNLAFILSDQFDQGTKLARFGDLTKNVFYDRRETSGSVLGQLRDSIEFIDKHNGRQTRIRGIVREDLYDYPEVAFRECLVNAVAHRDYGLKGTTLVSIYEDRLEVTSPGGLYGGFGIDDLMLGVSSRRNERLSSLLYRLGLMESYGTGIPRIMNLYEDEPFRPTIQTSANVFKITLPRRCMDDLSPEASEAIGALEGRPGFTRSDIEAAMGVPKSKAYAIVKELERAGVLEQTGTGKATVYRIVRPGTGGARRL